MVVCSHCGAEQRPDIHGPQHRSGCPSLDARINAHGRFLFGVPLTSAGYEVVSNKATGHRNGVKVGEASLRLYGTQADVEALVRAIS